MGRVIGVVSGKGGVGKTFVVANLALALRDFSKRVTVIDCNITTPHLSYYLGADDYSLNLNNVLRGEASIHAASYYYNGIYLVPSSSYLSGLIDIDLAKLKEHVSELGRTNDIVIIDTAPGLGKEATSALTSCEEIILVTTTRPPDLMDAIRCHLIARGMGIKTTGVVLNMMNTTKYELGEKRISALTGLPVLGTIPFDKKIVDSVRMKVPLFHLHPYSKSSEAFRDIAGKLVGKDHVPKGSVKRIYSRLKHKFKRWRAGNKAEVPMKFRFEEKVSTVADDILDMVKARNNMSVRELGERLGLEEKEAFGWCKALESRGLVRMGKTLFGKDTVKLYDRWYEEVGQQRGGK